MTKKSLFFLFRFVFSFVLFFVVGFVFLFNTPLAEAGVSVSINEIMYDLDEADIDWLEVYNDGNEEVDLSSLKLLISNSTSNHSIKSHSGSSVLGSGEYGIIVDNSKINEYIDKWGNSGNIFTASFSLPNVSEDAIATVEINAGDKNAPISSVTYEALLGAKGDGNSLQLLEGTFKGSIPTPGVENIFSPGDSESSDFDSGSGDGSDDDSAENSSTKEPKIKAKIFVPSVVFAREPVEFKGAILEDSKDGEYEGKYFWNFGDGVSLTEKGLAQKFKHIYEYPGDYAVLLDYYPDVFTNEPSLKSRIMVKSIPLQISIARAEGGRDYFGVKISNDSEYEVDISSWSIISGRKFFTFPKNSILLQKNSLTVSSRLMGFAKGDDAEIKLYSSTGELIAQY